MPTLYPSFQPRSKKIIGGLVARKTKTREEWNFWPGREYMLGFAKR
jgi:hypothetical protein